MYVCSTHAGLHFVPTQFMQLTVFGKYCEASNDQTKFVLLYFLSWLTSGPVERWRIERPCYSSRLLSSLSAQRTGAGGFYSDCLAESCKHKSFTARPGNCSVVPFNGSLVLSFCFGPAITSAPENIEACLAFAIVIIHLTGQCTSWPLTLKLKCFN